MIFDRMTPMYGQDMARPYGRDVPGRFRMPQTGGPGQVAMGGGFQTGGPGQSFQGPQFQTGGNTPPMVSGQFNTGGPGQQFRAPSFMTGGNTPPMQAQGWMTGGNQQHQFMGQPSALGMLYRRGAY